MNQTIDLQQLTKLPITTVMVANKSFPDIHIKTPHKGPVQIELTRKHYPFLFGSVTETDKNSGNVLYEIREIEEEAKDYLMNEWLKSVN